MKLRDMAPKGTVIHGTWEGVYYLAAILAATPYFLFKCWRGWTAGRAKRRAVEDIEQSKHEAWVIQDRVDRLRREHNERVDKLTREHNANVSRLRTEAEESANIAYQQSLTEYENRVTAWQRIQAQKAEEARNYIRDAPPAQRALALATQIERLESTELPAAATQLHEARDRLHRLSERVVLPEDEPAYHHLIDELRRVVTEADEAWRRFETVLGLRSHSTVAHNTGGGRGSGSDQAAAQGNANTGPGTTGGSTTIPADPFQGQPVPPPAGGTPPGITLLNPDGSDLSANHRI
jgi:hypothetical protein